MKKSRKPKKKKSRKSVKKKSRKPVKKKFIIMCDYTDKSIVLLGSTYAHKEEIKKAGGKYNPNLSVGKGWVFPKTKKKTVEKLVKKMRSAPAKSRKAVKKSRKKKAKKSSRKSSRKYKKKFRMKKGNCFQDCQGGICLFGGKERFHNIYYTGENKAKFCSPGIGVTDNEFTIGRLGDQGQIVDQSNCANPSKYAEGHVCHKLERERLREWNQSVRAVEHAKRVGGVKNLMTENARMNRIVARKTRDVDKRVTHTINKLLEKIAELDLTDTTALNALEFQREIGQSGFILQDDDTKQKVYNDYFKAIMKHHGGSKLKGFLTEMFGPTVATEWMGALPKLIPKFKKQVRALDKKQRELEEELAALQ